MGNRMLKWFDSRHLKPDLEVLVDCCLVLAEEMDDRLEEGPEKTAGMRKLLEAKDCFVRAKLEGEEVLHRSETKSLTATWTPPPDTRISG